MGDGEDAHSSLEVVPGPTTDSRSQSLFPDDPVFLRTEPPHDQVSPSQPSYGDSEFSKLEHGPGVYAEETGSRSNKTICGVSPLTFWILVALIFILCAGAIGGGVGGSIAVQANKSAVLKPR